MSQNKAAKSILREVIRQQLAQPSSDADRLQAAREAPRCMHVRANGVRCACPAMRGDAFCYFHDRLYNRPAEESFPFLEDAASIQMAIMQVLDGLRRGKLEAKVANSLLFGLQTASANLKRAMDSLQPVPSRVITQDPVSEARAARRRVPANRLLRRGGDALSSQAVSSREPTAAEAPK